MANHSVTRRTALGAAAVGVAALGGTQAMAQANERKTFVLVHGAWHGGWCWRRVADSLEQRGHSVFLAAREDEGYGGFGPLDRRRTVVGGQYLDPGISLTRCAGCRDTNRVMARRVD